jgi:hypothetical protein
MKWNEWAYFNGQWRYGSAREGINRRRAEGAITRAEYQTELQLIKQDILQKMFSEGRITKKDVTHPCPPQPTKVPKPPYIGKKISITKALPAHGRTHKITKLLKYTSEVPGGLPGLGKR